MHTQLLPVFRSDSQVEVLNAVYNATEPVSTSEVIQRTGLSQTLAHRELRRLVDAGLFEMTSVGRSHLFAPVERNPATPHLRALVNIAKGPQQRLRDALRTVRGIERALIFGSFAARSAGLPGDNPDDVDVLIIGTPERRDVYAAVEGIEEAVRREIHITFLRPERWAAGDEELVRRVRQQPVIDLLP